MNLESFLDEVRRQWRLLLAVVVGCALTAVILAALIPNRYVSTVQLLVTAKGTTTAAAYESLQLEQDRANSYVTLIRSDAVTQRVVDDLDLAESATELSGDVNAVIIAGTNVMDVAVVGDSAEQATRMAESLARQFSSYARAIETPTGGDDQKVEVTVLGGAGAATPQRPGPAMFGLLGAIVGLVLGCVAVWVRARRDGGVRSLAHAESASNIRGFGPVDPESPRATETYRALRTRAIAISKPVPDLGSVWLVTETGDLGQSASVALNLVRACASAGDSVVLVDANMRSDDPAEGPPDDQPDGLAEVLAGSAEIDGVLQQADGSSFAVIPAGGTEKTEVDVLALSLVLAQLRARYERVVVIGPEATSPPAMEIVSSVDAVLLVATLDRTHRRNLTRAADDMRTVGAEFAGLVLCAAPTPTQDVVSPRTDEERTSPVATSGG